MRSNCVEAFIEHSRPAAKAGISMQNEVVRCQKLVDAIQQRASTNLFDTSFPLSDEMVERWVVGAKALYAGHSRMQRDEAVRSATSEQRR